MTEKEMMQKNVEEFARLQKYMVLTEDKESAAYREMKGRYIELKVILSASGINLTELDIIKEQKEPGIDQHRRLNKQAEKKKQAKEIKQTEKKSACFCLPGMGIL